jgi:hypothetical protein
MEDPLSCVFVYGELQNIIKNVENEIEDKEIF